MKDIEIDCSSPEIVITMTYNKRPRTSLIVSGLLNEKSLMAIILGVCKLRGIIIINQRNLDTVVKKGLQTNLRKKNNEKI